jgi:hypothetical protein
MFGSGIKTSRIRNTDGNDTLTSTGTDYCVIPVAFEKNFIFYRFSIWFFSHLKSASNFNLMFWKTILHTWPVRQEEKWCHRVFAERLSRTWWEHSAAAVLSHTDTNGRDSPSPPLHECFLPRKESFTIPVLSKSSLQTSTKAWPGDYQKK